MPQPQGLGASVGQADTCYGRVFPQCSCEALQGECFACRYNYQEFADACRTACMGEQNTLMLLHRLHMALLINVLTSILLLTTVCVVSCSSLWRLALL